MEVYTNFVYDLYEQYVHNLSDAFDWHAPLVSVLTRNDSADCRSDSYRHAKSVCHQFESTSTYLLASTYPEKNTSIAF